MDEHEREAEICNDNESESRLTVLTLLVLLKGEVVKRKVMKKCVIQHLLSKRKVKGWERF